MSTYHRKQALGEEVDSHHELLDALEEANMERQPVTETEKDK